MIVVEDRTGFSRQTVLSLLLGPVLDPPGQAGRPVLDPAGRNGVLAWARKRPEGPLPLSGAPSEPVVLHGLLPVLAERQKRLDDRLATWTREGWWVIGRDDPAYPRRLRRRLGDAAPELLFGRGAFGLAGRGGVAVVQGGAADPDLAPLLRAALADSMLALISLPPVEHGIRIERVTSPGAIAHLRLSPPDATPDDHAALECCCYALADTVVAIGIGRDDPAFNGLAALAAQDRQPVWVLGGGGDVGLLVRAGARAVPPDGLAGGANALLLPAVRPRASAVRSPEPAATLPGPAPVSGFAEHQARFETGMPAARTPVLRLVRTGERRGASYDAMADGPTLFELFTVRLAALLTHGPLGAGRIAEAMDLTRPQVDAWLLRAQTEGAVLLDARTRLFRRPYP